MKSAVFFDIDGTIWNYDHYIPESAKEAIKKLRENGHKALLCSGRARAFIQHPDLLALGWDGIVCSCGCHIEIDGEMAYEQVLDEAEAERVIGIIRDHGFKPVLEGPKYLYMDDADFPVGDGFGDILRRDLGENLLQISGENYGKWKVNKLSCATEVDEDIRQACFKKLEDDYDIIEHNPFVCEIVPRGVSKATGMLHACELLGIDSKNTYALGDGENDIEMLRTANVGIAMGNGTDRAKENADFVTTAFDEDGIYNALKHFGLI